MPLADWKAFIRWLEEAKDEELIRRRDETISAIETGKLKSQDTIRKARFLVKYLDEEILSRLK